MRCSGAWQYVPQDALSILTIRRQDGLRLDLEVRGIAPEDLVAPLQTLRDAFLFVL
ncbi:MAG: hypothetical protein GXY85_08195 [Candidatus Brocadiaceae bacterium]|nr:hypothetical protein [Candidatus Brocadiaceae bacterium]